LTVFPWRATTERIPEAAAATISSIIVTFFLVLTALVTLALLFWFAVRGIGLRANSGRTEYRLFSLKTQQKEPIVSRFDAEKIRHVRHHRPYAARRLWRWFI